MAKEKILLRFQKTCGAYHKGDVAGFDAKLDNKFLRQVAAERAAEVVKASGKKGSEKIEVIGTLADDGSVIKAAAKPKTAKRSASNGNGGSGDGAGDGGSAGESGEGTGDGGEGGGEGGTLSNPGV